MAGLGEQHDALAAHMRLHTVAVVLDLKLPKLSGWHSLGELRLAGRDEDRPE